VIRSLLTPRGRALGPDSRRRWLAENVACGLDPDLHAAKVRKHIDADIDEI
jgi:hypothetical protein